MHPILIDAVGMPALDLYEFVILVALSPFVLAFLIIKFFRFLDWLSARAEKK
jgi:hypothetical protein